MERKIDELSKRVSELDEKFKKSVKALQHYTTSINSVLSLDMTIFGCAVGLWYYPSISLSDFDAYMRNIKEKETIIERIHAEGLTVSCISSSHEIDIIIQLCFARQILFERIAPYLIEKLGGELAEKLVRKRTLVHFYGKEVLPAWESMLKEKL